MALPTFFFERVTADILQQMEGVLALSEQLGRQHLTPDARACLDALVESAAGARRMLSRALDLRAVFENGLTLAVEPAPLRPLMDELQARWRDRAAQAQVTLLISYDGDPEAVALGDARRLAQVFDGLIGEALASVSRGAVEVTLRVRPFEQGLLVEGFVRGPLDVAWRTQDLEAQIRSVDGRFGLEAALGMMIARQVLEAMGAELAQTVHAGGAETTAFTLRMPNYVPVPVPAGRAAERAAHILVVDDNATNRMVAQTLVEMFHCTSEEVHDGVEAVEAARSGRFDLILMDIKMPRMDGVTAARTIRAMDGRPGQTPIIAITANADPDDALAYLAAGMNGVVEKPMKPEHLLAALQQALQTPEGDLGAAAVAA